MSSNYLIIIDSISTSAEQDWLRIFNLSDDVDEVSIISENTIKVIMKDDEIFYFTSYMNPLEKINGQHSPRIGWLAIPQIKLDPSNAIIQKNTKSKTKFILGISRNNPLEYEYENDVLYIQDPSTTDAVQFNIDNVVINETPLEKNHLESSFNIQKTNSLLYSTWLRIRDYRVQLLYLNVIALCMILIFIMIINGIKLYKNRFLVYAITVLFSYICMIIIFVTFIK
jgi:hypothetical protein